MFHPIGILITIVITVLSCALEAFLAKRGWLAGLIIPVIAVILAIIFDFDPVHLGLAGILCVVLIVVRMRQKVRTK